MSQWKGYAVSVACAEPLGCYQGRVAAADGATLTLHKPFRNGFPYPKAQVTLNASDIKSLSIIEAAPSEPPSAGTGGSGGAKGTRGAGGAGGAGGCGDGKAGRRRHHKATVCESLQASHSHGSAGGGGGAGVSVGKGGGGGGGGGKGVGRRRDELAFGPTAVGEGDEEFDFEGNLALFDKRALWRDMEAQAQAQARPDVVPPATVSGAYRHDQNVLGAPPAPGAIVVPLALRGPWEYVTDEGLRVPSAAGGLRARLWAAMARHGLLEGALVLLARAAADVCLRLCGGGRRLEARNAHQAPRAVVLAGPHAAGRCALTAARLLASHGVSVACCLCGVASDDDEARLAAELAALALAEVPVARSAAALGPGAVDVVLVALQPAAAQAAGAAWAAGARAALVALEPPPEGWPSAGLSARCSVQALLPAALAPALGRAYLADVAPPPALMAALGVHYRPPFGASALLPLHPADD